MSGSLRPNDIAIDACHAGDRSRCALIRSRRQGAVLLSLGCSRGWFGNLNDEHMEENEPQVEHPTSADEDDDASNDLRPHLTEATAAALLRSPRGVWGAAGIRDTSRDAELWAMFRGLCPHMGCVSPSALARLMTRAGGVRCDESDVEAVCRARAGGDVAEPWTFARFVECGGALRASALDVAAFASLSESQRSAAVHRKILGALASRPGSESPAQRSDVLTWFEKAFVKAAHVQRLLVRPETEMRTAAYRMAPAFRPTGSAASSTPRPPALQRRLPRSTARSSRSPLPVAGGATALAPLDAMLRRAPHIKRTPRIAAPDGRTARDREDLALIQRLSDAMQS